MTATDDNPMKSTVQAGRLHDAVAWRGDGIIPGM
ncbi:hypothetical protein P3T27_005463 [Kitasatospora sp. MAA19]|nr:hypothetical protein [Kitasatospora sp. MAA19]